MQFLNTLHAHENIGARTSVAVMLAEMQDKRTAGNLHIKRHSLGKSMLPIQIEAEKAEIKFTGFLYVENAKDRTGLLKLDCHSETPLRLIIP
nr:hypothetical protein TR92_14885 [Brucella anthropi]